MKDLEIRDIVLSGVMIALVAVLTLAVRVPFPLTQGYFNFSDVGAFLAGFAFGPWMGLIAGGIGSALADVAGGYPMFAPLTFLAHGLEGFVAGAIAGRTFNLPRMIAGWAAGALIMVGFYFVGEAYVLQMGVGFASKEIPINLLQVVVGGAVSIPLVAALRKAYPPILQWGNWRA